MKSKLKNQGGKWIAEVKEKGFEKDNWICFGDLVGTIKERLLFDDNVL